MKWTNIPYSTNLVCHNPDSFTVQGLTIDCACIWTCIAHGKYFAVFKHHLNYTQTICTWYLQGKRWPQVVCVQFKWYFNITKYFAYSTHVQTQSQLTVSLSVLAPVLKESGKCSIFSKRCQMLPLSICGFIGDICF